MKRMLVLTGFLLLAMPVRAQRPGDAVFNTSRVHEINIVMTQPNFYDSLIQYKRKRDSTGITTWMVGTVFFNGTRLDTVGVRLKGNSSFGYPGMKKPIKLKFNEWMPGQNVDGLKRLNFNNNTLDPSYMREKLFLDWMNEQGMNAPRCTYARVSYNGQYAGLFKIIEDVDKVFLKDRFGNDDGNLFKGDPGGALTWAGLSPSAYYRSYELHTNEIENDWNDLVRLIRVINTTPGPVFRDSLEAVLHVDTFIRDWAANNVFANLDSYMFNPHNYFLYHNTRTGKFEWIAWDVSVVFGFFPFMKEAQTINWDIGYLFQPSQQRPLTANLMANATYRSRYQNTLCRFGEHGLVPEKLYPRIDSIANVIRPHIYAEPDGNQSFPESMFEGNINFQTFTMGPHDIPGLKRFISERRNSILQQRQAKGWECQVTSVENPAAVLSVSVYPNPAQDFGVVSIAGAPEGRYSLTLFDLLGRVVRARELHTGNHIIERESLPCGMYILELSHGEKTTRARIVFR